MPLPELAPETRNLIDGSLCDASNGKGGPWNASGTILFAPDHESPIHRVPGNHDITDLATRDVYFRRYGRVPSAVRVGKVLFLLLSTTRIPADGDTAQKIVEGML